MLLYKNHRFFCQGISFAIPDGYYLDTNYEEIQPDTLHIWNQEQDLYIRVGIEYNTKGPHTELAFILHELEECVIEKHPYAVSYGGLSGFCATYSVGDKHYSEIRLAICGCEDNQTELLLLFRSSLEPLNEHLVDTILCKIAPLRD